ncbi:hypothetical protein CGLO_10634 [Colletotrichum gloeosporioides Cg-14]|uniref:Uncharacterized protein n=1 Tax=Colletotrichum gloeosporioides (strain Cg-14) TaxID=1237896 RepID=T0KD57_COLGC|nr:hypothetical protein CGLO_10634 [Colletotrichum gloeosporioides Cg-14]
MSHNSLNTSISDRVSRKILAYPTNNNCAAPGGINASTRGINSNRNSPIDRANMSEHPSARSWSSTQHSRNRCQYTSCTTCTLLLSFASRNRGREKRSNSGGPPYCWCVRHIISMYRNTKPAARLSPSRKRSGLKSGASKPGL